MQRVTRQGAASILQVSEATVDRMVRRGDLQAEKEPQGSRYRLWILLDEDAVTTLADNKIYTNEETADTLGDGSADRSDDSEDLAALKAENAQLRELADFRKQLLDDSEWRYHQLVQQLNLSQEANLALIRALPPAIAETTQGEPPSPPRWRWWPFGNR